MITFLIMIVACISVSSRAQTLEGHFFPNDEASIRHCSPFQQMVITDEIQITDVHVSRGNYLLTLASTMQNTTCLTQYMYDLFLDTIHIDAKIWGIDLPKTQGQDFDLGIPVELKDFFPEGQYNLVITFNNDEGISVGCIEIDFVKPQKGEFLISSSSI